MQTLHILSSLLRQFDTNALSKQMVIPWAAPIPSFGNLAKSKIATLGINPSNREFVDVTGKELGGLSRRFHTLKSLGIKRWSDASKKHLLMIQRSCDEYFTGNPYDSWFRALDKLILGADVSYYGMFSNACHLDLVPYATSCKWTELSTTQKSYLLNSCGNALGHLLRESPVEVLVLNGQSVIENLQSISKCTFRREAIPEWTLPRRSGIGVTGYAYSGKLTQISGVALEREVAVLGFSHNIQSSFGVTTKVKNSIQDWISRSANNGVLC